MEELKKTPGTGMEAAGQQTGLSLAEAEKRCPECAGEHDRDRLLPEADSGCAAV